ncbi:hypothetical protein S7711_00736 [Stachybotrys chartarum IBT 7711]|uniref:HTH La-type RNA-binding domain-containing protein n=1 Tax=Stachybotrys chartarum (strain CBS 109288 / IBT 7711) TaxID=1280523 RepID=A0A084B014_STACB|nr:hypothetical protein S7711_00736 [Stachybotrys chartarum IBT 7711]KFA49506.1 hypothetical protein S40293_02848 [Stachybotrys chartarum IBT 40293]
MSEVDAATKPVEAVDAALAQPAEAQAQTTEEKPAEEKPVAEAPSAEKPAEASVAEDKPAEQSASADSALLKTKAKTDYDNLKNNRKFDPSTREVTDDPDAIRKQVEFYFGDWNFPQDKFMWETCGGADNKPVPIKTLHTFKRMRIFQPYTAVVAALRDSTFLEVSGEEGEELVKRKVAYKPMPTAKAKAEAATVYVKGFGDETSQTQFELEKFFGDFGSVKGIKLRRTNENLFKGSVFVTFADEETAKKFIALDPAPKWNDHELKIMSKHDYCEEKSELIRQGKLDPSGAPQRKFYEGRDSNARGGRGRRGGPHQDDWKKRREHDQKDGFQDRRGGGRGRGRGGRGRGGRGGRDRDRDSRSGRDDRRDDRRPPQDEKPVSTNDVKLPQIQTAADDKPANSTTNGKRAREDDDGGAKDAPVAKKVDVKED